MTTEEICEKYKIENYTINDDESIDVNGDVDLYNRGLVELPLRFNRVYGDFRCTNNYLTTLEGSPKWVEGDFSCSGNRLTSLEFSPDYVGGDYGTIRNGLTDLVGSPKEVGGNFYCANNELLNNPKGCTEKIGKELKCDYTPLSSIFNRVDKHFLHAFNFYKIIKDDTINLKRLKYVMDLYDKPINLNRIEKYYRIV